MSQDTMTVYPPKEELRVERQQVKRNRFFVGIEDTLRARGRPVQRVLCALMMAVLTAARLPAGGYACQCAMFAVLLRLGFCVPSAFAGVLGGFVVSYGLGDLACCWQLPCCTVLWLTAGLWARRESVGTMAAAVFAVLMTGGLITGMDTPLAIITLTLTSAAGAGLCVLYDGAAMTICRRDELDGETRPICVMSVLASICAGLLPLPGGEILACSLSMYMTLEHAYVGGGQQAILCAGVMGGATALGMVAAHPCAMLLCGGFLAGEIKTHSRLVCALLMLLGMVAAGALLGGDLLAIRLFLYCAAGLVPFLVLSPARRVAVTNLIEHSVPEELTQSEAVAVRCAGMIHAWARLYDDTARIMDGLCEPQDGSGAVRQCVQLLKKTSMAAHQVLERTLGEIRPDDESYRRIRYALVRTGAEEVRVAYALRIGGRLEVMLTKPEHVAPVTLTELVSGACGVPMRPAEREGALSTQALFEQSPELNLEIGAATRSRSGEAVAGDSYMSRAMPGGRHVLALSDGMGSGVSARQESHAALELLAESLNAGYTRAQALDVVNNLMLMCTGREMYATMDLCVCDLHSGETAFEKLGACPSYVVRDGEVRAIGADTLPVGVLPDVEARSLRMTLQPGDVVVMLTDGVADAYPGGEGALREAIGKLAWLHPQAVGEKLIAQAVNAAAGATGATGAIGATGAASAAKAESGAKKPKAAGSGDASLDDMAVLCARVTRAMYR